jgi:hypothetical protein
MDSFKWGLFAYYIFIGTVQVILMKASGESAKGTGKGLAYNTASAMVFIEAFKILVCLGMEQYQGDAYRAEKGEARKTSNLQGWLVYAVPGFLYAVENNLKIPATVYLHPHVFALFNNSKVIFAAIGMVILLGKRFSVLQWMSMALLGMSLCIAKVQMILPLPVGCEEMAASDNKEDVNAGLFFFGILLVLGASMLSGLAGVSNELLLKKRDKDVGLWRKNIWTYQWGVIFNSFGLVTSYLFGGDSTDSDSGSLLYEFFRGYDFWVWAMIFVTALLGISVSMIMKYFDNVVKCFGGSLILYSTTIASMVIFGSKVDAGFVLGLMTYSVSSYFYAGNHNAKLDKYAQYEVEIEAMISGKMQKPKEMLPLTKEENLVPVEETEISGEQMGSGTGERGAVLGRQTGAKPTD